MNVNDMLVFAEVVERGGFTAAGEALGKPKSNISRIVSRLEAELGTQLLKRTTRKHSLTQIGEVYYQHVVRIKEEIESANTCVETLTTSPIGRIRVCASITTGQSLLSHHLAGFAKAYPNICLDLRLTNRRVDLIEEGFDIAIRVGKSDDSNLIAKYMCSHTLQLYASPALISRIDTPLETPQDLQQFPCLYMNAVSERAQWRLTHQQQAEVAEIALRPVVSSDDFHVLRQLALDGAGITLLPEYMGAAYIEAGSLLRVLEDWAGAKVDFHMMVSSRKAITPKIRAFLDYFAQVYR